MPISWTHVKLQAKADLVTGRALLHVPPANCLHHQPGFSPLSFLRVCAHADACVRQDDCGVSTTAENWLATASDSQRHLTRNGI
jgi:hypothetical protein